MINNSIMNKFIKAFIIIVMACVGFLAYLRLGRTFPDIMTESCLFILNPQIGFIEIESKVAVSKNANLCYIYYDGGWIRNQCLCSENGFLVYYADCVVSEDIIQLIIR